MKISFIVAAVMAALCAGSVMADEIDAQVAAALTATKTQVAAQKESAAQVTEQQHRREPAHEGRGPEHRRGRWEHGRFPRDGWRPAHFSRYLGYSYDMAECQAFGRADGFPFVTRYNFSGDCYGDFRPF